MKETQDLHVIELIPIVPPRQLKAEFPATDAITETVYEGRQVIKRMLRGKDNRLLVIVGPCSIHDEKAALEYAGKLAALRQELNDRLFIVMRVYFEKPRTTIGWKGLIYDPRLDGSGDMDLGLRQARNILLNINAMNLPAATEFLDPIVPQYIDDLVTWAAIGARTTESQTHRELSSGLSMPFGFKNSTDGNLQIAIDAMCSSRAPHTFLGVDQNGKTAIVKTTGNVWGHIILRGGRNGPNYDKVSIQRTQEALAAHRLPATIMVDCSHANSNKDFTRQEKVLQDVVEQRIQGDSSLFGVMIESNLLEGKQSLGDDPSQLKYGISITDGCIGWETTERILRDAYQSLGKVLS